MTPGELDGVLERLELTLSGGGYTDQAARVAHSRAALADFIGAIAGISGFGKVVELSISVELVLSTPEG